MLQTNQMVKALSLLHRGKVMISELRKNKVGGITAPTWEVVASDIPCHLSYKQNNPALPSDTTSSVSKVPTLFIESTYIVKKGSRATITQDGRVMHFTCSGEPSVYPSHQEIPLALHEDHI